MFGKYGGRIRVKTEREYGLGMRNRRQVIATWKTKPRKKFKEIAGYAIILGQTGKWMGRN